MTGVSKKIGLLSTVLQSRPNKVFQTLRSFLKTRIFWGGFLSIQIVISSSSFGLSELQKVSLNPEESSVLLRFLSPVDPSHVKTEFFRDIIQISIKGASVYPAKVISSDVGSLKKVFAYQYTPKLVRARLTVEGKASDYRDQVKVRPMGRTIQIELNEGPYSAIEGDDIRETRSSAIIHKKVDKATKRVKIGLTSDREKALLSKIMKSDVSTTKLKETKKSLKLTPKLAGGAELPSPWGVLGWTLLLVSVIITAAMFVKKLKTKSSSALSESIQGKLQQFLGGMTGQRVGGSRMIEVVSSQSLGPKRTITVVKVKGALLVLGITDGNINLITRLDTEGNGPGRQAPSPETSLDFEDIVRSEQERPQPVEPRRRSGGVDVRHQIRQRLQGMKNL